MDGAPVSNAPAATGGKDAARPVRLMVVDDSTVARAVLSRMIESDPAFKVVAAAASAEDALEALKHVDLDIVILDLEMPGAGGLKKLPEILEAANGAQVLVCSALAEEGAEVTVSALAMGAADTLPKPGTGRFHGTFSDVLLGKLRQLGHAVERSDAPLRPAVRWVPEEPTAPFTAFPLREMRGGAMDVLLIGASTGGIHALGSFFEALPDRIGVPICVTQHLPAAFMPVLARQLSRFANRPAHVAEDGHPLLADRVYIAPGDAHLIVADTKQGLMAKLDDAKAPTHCMPSVDPMFESAARACGNRACAVVLTGMGRDGSEGAKALVARGGDVLVQERDSSAVWGMPRSVYEAGLACALGTPQELARKVAERVEA